MTYFYQLKGLLVLFLISIGVAYAQAHDSSSVTRFANNAKKRCCYIHTDTYVISWESEGYNQHSAKYSTAFVCSRDFSRGPANAPIDYNASIVAFGQYGDQTYDGPQFPGKLPEWAKKINYIRCTRHITVCGYADPTVPSNAYNATNCR